MLEGRRPIWKSATLHLVLIGGSLIFALPYLWMLGTSWKLDKEVMTEDISIFPQRPIPRPRSPYVDERQFPPLERPESVGRHVWGGWMEAALTEEIGRGGGCLAG